VALFVCLLIPSLFLNSSIVKDRINLGINEISNVSAAYEKETSMGSRIIAWKNAIELIKEHPLLGVGTGGYEPAFVDHVKDQKGQENFLHHDPHNQFLKILAELGLIGFLIFIGLALIYVFRFFQVVNERGIRWKDFILEGQLLAVVLFIGLLAIAKNYLSN
jgi:O-antigen ligase